MSRILVDAMNVIGTRPTGWWRDRPGAIRRLADRLSRLAREEDVAYAMVVDGQPLEDLPEGERDGLAVYYARRRGPDAADDRIVELVSDAPGKERPSVVTSDRGLRERLAPLGAEVRPASELWRRLDALGD